MAWSLRTPIGAELDLASQACEETLLSHLYQRLVRYTEQNVRHAVRLDHAPADGTDEPHPLVHVLVSNQGRDALDELIERESAATLDADLTAHGSLAAAYLHLLDHFDSRMAAVADHLLISKSYAYRCCARARLLATHLQHISIPISDPGHLPGPWRRFRLHRTPVQLSLDFDDELLC
ncbi:MAG TPA: hypothetical protein VJS30_02555 [Paraburkholderia sp.]|nr:hypothetical protein [Paraburkholderia sp.]